MKRVHIQIDYDQWSAFSAVCRPDQLPAAIKLGLDCAETLINERVAERLAAVPEGGVADVMLRVVVRNLGG